MEKAKAKSSRLKKLGILLVLSLSLAIIVIDSTVLNVSMQKLIEDLHTDIQSIQWVVSIYSLVIAALTIAGGRMGDFFGRKKMFVLGAIIFAIGSLVSSFSTDVVTLLLGWSVIEGIGAALMMPAASALIITNFQGKSLPLALGLFGGIAGASSALGPIVGGFLTTNASWHWAFRINIVITLVLVAGSVLIKEARDEKVKRDIDFLGIFLSSISMVLIVFGVIESSTYGWITAKQIFTIFGQDINLGSLSIVPVSIVLGLILLAVFAWWENRVEKRGRVPLVSVKLFANRQYTSGVITTSVMSLGQTGLIFSLPIFLQSVVKLDAFETGVALLPLSLAILVASPLAITLAKRFQPRLIILAGLFINIIAVFVLRATVSVDATASTLIPGMLIYGFGMGLVMAQINNLTLSAVDPAQAGEATGVSATMRQVGSSLGSAIIGAVFLSVFSSNLTDSVNNYPNIPQQAKTGMVQFVEKASSGLVYRGASADQLPKEFAPITKGIKPAIVAGNQDALLVSSGLIVLTVIAALNLPNTMKKDMPKSKVIVA